MGLILKGQDKVTYIPHEVPESVLVSVVIITYNHENFIQQCLDSILNQNTNFPFEILISEDASSDKTREICLKYAERYKDKIRLFLHSRDNNMVIDGMPTGRYPFVWNLQHANGNYIAFCEGDDYWTDINKLQEQYDLFQSNKEVSLVFTNVDHNYLEKNEIVKSVLNNKNLPAKTNWKQLIKSNPMATCSIMIKNWIKPNGLPSLYLNFPMGDWPLWLLTGQYGDYYYLNKSMAAYRIHKGGLWSKKGFQFSVLKKIKALKVLKRLSNLNWLDRLTISIEICIFQYKLNINRFKIFLKP